VTTAKRDGEAKAPKTGRGRRGSGTAALAAATAAIRREHIGRLLLVGFRVFEGEALARFETIGFSDLRLSHLALIRNLPPEGIRTSEIADLTGLTKQAVGQLATELEEFGYCERVPDPTDGRAKLLTFTVRGQELYAEIPKILTAIEAEFETVLGTSDMAALRRSLKKLALAHGSDKIG